MLWLGIWAVWTILALMSASQTALTFTMRGIPIEWTPLVVGRLADWYTCAMFTPLFYWMARRWPLERTSWRRCVAIYLPVSIAAVVLKYAIYVPLMRALSGRDAAVSQILAANVLVELMFVWATIGGVHAIEFYRRYRERESAAHRLSAELSRAQLEALRAQLHPHFLFNTLNAIATLIHSDPDSADVMVSKLADLLRGALQHASGTDCTLADELALARTYVDIMQRRFTDRVAVAWNVDPSLGPARVPAFLFQPLLENAFEHGAGKSNGKATRVTVSARRVGDALHMSVIDDGPGTTAVAEGVGLSNTRKRLFALYGAAASLVIGPGVGGGTTVTATIPWGLTP